MENKMTNLVWHFIGFNTSLYLHYPNLKLRIPVPTPYDSPMNKRGNSIKGLKKSPAHGNKSSINSDVVFAHICEYSYHPCSPTHKMEAFALTKEMLLRWISWGFETPPIQVFWNFSVLFMPQRPVGNKFFFSKMEN